MRFLIDECLSPSLAALATAEGHDGSVALGTLRLGGALDSEVTELACANGYVLVTRNARDFRGTPGLRRKGGHYAARPGHPGLICLHSDGAFRRPQQVALFLTVLRNLERQLVVGAVGKVFEAMASRDGSVELVAYWLPV